MKLRVASIGFIHATALLAGCGGSSTESSAAHPTAVASTSSSQETPNLPAPRPDRVALGTPHTVALEPALIPIAGARDEVLVVSDFARASQVYVQIAHGGAESLLAPAAIAHAHVIAAARRSNNDLVLVTTEGEKVCQRILSEDATSTTAGDPVCSAVHGYTIVPVGDRLLVVDAAPPPPPEEEPEVTPPKQPPKQAPKPPPTKKPKTKQKPKPKKKVDSKAAVAKLMSSGRDVEVTTTWLEADGSLSEPVASGLKFREAMAGLGFIGAGARTDRIDVLFYERIIGKPPKAQIGFAKLDLEGALDEPSRKDFGSSKLEPGFLSDHVDVRLLTLDSGSIALGQRGPRGKCDVTVVAPFVMQMIPDDRDCALDPRRFLDIALARHAGKDPVLGDPTTLARDKARRAFGQAAWDVGKTAHAQLSTWTLTDDGLVRVGANELNAVKPMSVARLRIGWGALAPDGRALADTDEGLVSIDRDGTPSLVKDVHARALGGPDRPDVAAANGPAAVLVGDTWWQATGELRRLVPYSTDAVRALAPDSALVVGGAERGLVVEIAGGVLHADALSSDGTLTPLGSVASPLRAGFAATSRTGGGALLVGPSTADPARVVAVVLDPSGALSPPETVFQDDASARDVARSVRVVARPGGGAWVFDHERTRVAWLDDEGHVRANANLPIEHDLACIDGRPLPSVVPSTKPGETVPLEAARVAGSCVSSEVVALADGSLRWLGSRVAGATTVAELGTAPAGTVPATSSSDTTVSNRDDKKLASDGPKLHCPGDMVWVSTAPGRGENPSPAMSYCVDRFEGTLEDRRTGQYLSADYPGTPNLLTSALSDFATRRERHGDLYARALPLPLVSAWQRGVQHDLVVVARASVTPSGFVTGLTAKAACEATGKRLCKLEEWKTACRGQDNTLFPYGSNYEDQKCNVNGLYHPAAILHDNASLGHLDPRLNLVEPPVGGGPLLHPTGTHASCASRWGDDAIYDMVGNLDEWVDEKTGAFAGGFYSRGTTNGCEALVSNHEAAYLDYSTGVRCCRDAD
ncbi:MAG: hypothetical protein U0271_35570 [Polyangiaceae bacterium]